MIWCEFCRDHFDRDHFDAPWTSPFDGEVYPDGGHGVGPGYGPVGRSLAIERSAFELLDVTKDLGADQWPEHLMPVVGAINALALACMPGALDALRPVEPKEDG